MKYFVSLIFCFYSSTLFAKVFRDDFAFIIVMQKYKRAPKEEFANIDAKEFYD
jgi:hypothetical protein